MAKYYASAQEELRARQRSLIPLNIFVAILALVAALSQVAANVFVKIY